MAFLTALDIINYGLVLLFGLFLSTFIAGGWRNRQQKQYIFALCPLLLLIQGIAWCLWGTHTVERLYPLIIHLPLLLILIFILKTRAGVAMVSVCTAYLCCQIPHWVNLVTVTLTKSDLLAEIAYTLAILTTFFLLQRYFARIAFDAMSYSIQSLVLFGALPLAYYIFDYATTVYSDALYIGNQVLTEFLPTVLIIFYVLFLTAYHAQEQKRTQAELQRSMLEAELKQAESEMENLRRTETQTAIYQHDMRHHMTMLGAYLASGNPQQAESYVKKVQADVDAIVPRCFCENKTINLICSAFADRAAQKGVLLQANVRVPRAISISDTELCAVISNGLENALRAASVLETPGKWVSLYCEIKHGKLLIEIKNPYTGEVSMQNGLPTTKQSGHGFGCRSIRTITEHNRGLCTFESENGVFTLQVILPVC